MTAAADAAPLDPVAAQAVAQGAVPLLYYAVWLPAPNGQPAGPPIYLPAAGAGGGAGMPFASVPPAPPAALPAGAGPAPATLPPPVMESPADAARAHNQKLLVTGLIALVFLVHLPWLVYLVGVHGCWGSFLENCFAPSEEVDLFADAAQPMLFARVTFLMLRVQSVLAGDWAEFSQAMQISTGVGSFVLTKIVAANGLIAEGRLRIWLLAATCGLAFAVLFWAELHLGGTVTYPELGDETILAYIDQNLPPEFMAFDTARTSLTEYLQFLRLADALILGAALAMPTTQRTTA
ncbi:MAG: hypothetical protein RIR62_2943 [Pseudomonadota bacterium]|jgi:hypothetical protein